MKKSRCMTTFIFLLTTTVLGAYSNNGNNLYQLKSGIQYLKNGQPSRAVQILEKVSRTRPDLAETWFYLGKAYKQLKNNSSAVRCFEKSHQIKPRHIPSLLELALLLSDRDATKGDSYKLAAQAYQMAPKSTRVQQVFAIASWKNNYIQQAEKLFQQVLLKDKNNHMTHFYLGMIANSQGNFQQALNRFQTSLNLNATVKAHLAIGDLYEKSGQLNRAAHHLKRAYRLEGRENSRLALFLKKKIERLEKSNQANLFNNVRQKARPVAVSGRTSFNNLTANSSQNKRPPSRRGKYRIGPSSYDTGIDFAGNYNGAYENFSENSGRHTRQNKSREAATQSELDYHLNLAQGYFRQGLLNESAREIQWILGHSNSSYQRNQALKIQNMIRSQQKQEMTKFGETHLNLALNFLSRNRLKEAENELNKARQLTPQKPELYKNFAILCIKKGDIESARDFLKKSLLLSPNSIDTHILMALILNSEGRYEEAAGFAKKARQFASDEKRESFLDSFIPGLEKKLANLKQTDVF